MLAGGEAFWFELFLGCVYLAYSVEALAVSYLGMEVTQIALHWKMEGLQLNLLLPGANFCTCTGPRVVLTLPECKHLKCLAVGLCRTVQNVAALRVFALRL